MNRLLVSFSVVWGGESLGAGAVGELTPVDLLMFLLMLPEITQLQYISTPVRPSNLLVLEHALDCAYVNCSGVGNFWAQTGQWMVLGVGIELRVVTSSPDRKESCSISGEYESYVVGIYPFGGTGSNGE